MIKANDKGVYISGDMAQIAFDFMMIIKSVHEVMSDEIGDENARHMIADLGKLAFFDDEDGKELMELFKEIREEWNIILKGEENDV